MEQIKDSALDAETDKLIAEHFPAEQVKVWKETLERHWKDTVIPHGDTNRNEWWILKAYGRLTPREGAKRHLRLIARDLMDGAGRALGATKLRGVKFEALELVIRPTASGETEYDGGVYDWTCDGAVQINGMARLGDKAVRAVSLFVTHPFHQYKAVPINPQLERRRQRLIAKAVKVRDNRNGTASLVFADGTERLVTGGRAREILKHANKHEK